MLTAGVDHQDLAKRGESLIRQSSNRYLTTVRIALRAKQRRFGKERASDSNVVVDPARATRSDAPGPWPPTGAASG